MSPKIPSTSNATPPRTITYKQWRGEAVDRFGEDTSQWAFICPVCKTRQTAAECLAAGATSNTIGFSCIGRSHASKGCNYAGGGLFKLNPVTVTHFPGMDDGETDSSFEFAENKCSAMPDHRWRKKAKVHRWRCQFCFEERDYDPRERVKGGSSSLIPKS